ncbi:hypothetical protein CR513_38370, partial [Mucuna pruriens]
MTLFTYCMVRPPPLVDLHVPTMALNGLVGGNQELLPQLNDHICPMVMLLLRWYILFNVFYDLQEDIVVSIVVERAHDESQRISRFLQSLCWGSSAFREIYAFFLVKEQPRFSIARGKKSSFCWARVFGKLKIEHYSVMGYQITLQSDSTMFYFTTNSLGFTRLVLGCVDVSSLKIKISSCNKLKA